MPIHTVEDAPGLGALRCSLSFPLDALLSSVGDGCPALLSEKTFVRASGIGSTFTQERVSCSERLPS
jgi:hypothetical protein